MSPSVESTLQDSSRAAAPIVELQSVEKRYGEGESAFTALHEISLSIPSGRMVALVGASGSGKSTLLNLLGAVDRPSTGTISIGGRDLSKLTDADLALFRRRRLGFVFQSFHLLPSLTVFDNVAVPFTLDRKLTAARRNEINQLLSRLGVADKAQRYPDELSGGQQQRVALARAVIHRPDLVLADEPTGNLDAATGRIILDLLVELQREFGVTVIMATHSDEAAARCDDRIRLADGRVIPTQGALEVSAVIGFFAKLTAGHFRKHRLEALLCLIGVTLGVAVVVSIDSAVAACVRSFQGAVGSLAERSTHSIFAENGELSDDNYIALAKQNLGAPMAPMIDRGVLVSQNPAAPTTVARLIGIDVFSEKSLRSFTRMKSVLSDDAFHEYLTVPNTVVLVDDLAQRIGAKAGDTITLTVNSRRIDAKVTGITQLTGVAHSQLSDLIIADLATAQEMTDSLGKIDRIDLNIESPQIERAISAALPSGLVLRSTQQQSTSLSELIASYKLNLNSLSLMASFVAIFIVYNSMLISVQQRVTGLGILRCLGASRRQLGSLCFLEAIVFAIVGGVLGVIGGWALSKLLVGYVSTTINDLYAALRPGPVSLDWTAFAKGLAVSVTSCLVGAAIPLMRAAQTPPVNVFRGTARAGASARASTALLFIGIALLLACWGIYRLPTNSPVIGFILALLVALAFAFICPAATRAFCRLVNRTARPMQSLPVQMAAAGVGRSLGITGVAVAAMMLGMAMTIGVRTMVSSFRGALDTWMDRRFSADVFVAPELLVNHKIDATIDPRVEEWIKSQQQTAAVIGLRTMTTPINGKSVLLLGTDMDEILSPQFPIKSSENGREFDAKTDILISEPLAGRTHWSPGEDINLDTPTGPHRFHIHAIFYDFGNERGQIIIQRQAYAAIWHDVRLTSLHVRLKPGNDPQAMASQWSGELRKTYPVVSNSFGHVKHEVMNIFDRTFKVTDVLSWLAGGVAFCGLAGSLLSLSLARQRDYSVLAAVGMSRGQTATWVFGQGLLIAWISAAVAAVAGTVLAYVLSYVIQYRSFGWSIPTSPQPRFWLEAFILATIAAAVAAIYPVHRLTRIAPAESLRQE